VVASRPTILVATPVAVASIAAAVGPSPSAVAATPAAGSVPQQPSVAYVVQPGDSLQGIAQQHYGDAGEWTRIYQANRSTIGPDPDALQAGTTLQLPPPNSQ
jgi:nucleoid-associated protein YgaU